MSIEGEKFIDVGGVKTRYVEKGEGDIVVLFHGGSFGSATSADAIEDWGQTIDDLARWSHVFAIDKLGQGYTGNPKSDDEYSYSSNCVTDDWLDALVEIAQQQKYAEAIDKMNNVGLQWTKFLPGLQSDKEEMFRILAQRGIQRPVMQIWGHDDPTVSHPQAFDLYKILAEKERRARWQILNQAGHFSFREQPKRFDEVVRSFVADA